MYGPEDEGHSQLLIFLCLGLTLRSLWGSFSSGNLLGNETLCFTVRTFEKFKKVSL